MSHQRLPAPEPKKKPSLNSAPTIDAAGSPPAASGAGVFDDLELASYIEDVLSIKVAQMETSLLQAMREGFRELGRVQRALDTAQSPPQSEPADLLHGTPAEPVGWEHVLVNTQEEVRELTAQLAERDAEIERLQGDLHDALAATSAREEHLASELAVAEQQLEGLSKQLEQAQRAEDATLEIQPASSADPAMLSALESSLAEARTRISVLEEELKRARHRPGPPPSRRPLRPPKSRSSPSRCWPLSPPCAKKIAYSARVVKSSCC
jgi:hypothetical protein